MYILTNICDRRMSPTQTRRKSNTYFAQFSFLLSMLYFRWVWVKRTQAFAHSLKPSSLAQIFGFVPWVWRIEIGSQDVSHGTGPGPRSCGGIQSLGSKKNPVDLENPKQQRPHVFTVPCRETARKSRCRMQCRRQGFLLLGVCSCVQPCFKFRKNISNSKSCWVPFSFDVSFPLTPKLLGWTILHFAAPALAQREDEFWGSNIGGRRVRSIAVEKASAPTSSRHLAE